MCVGLLRDLLLSSCKLQQRMKRCVRCGSLRCGGSPLGTHRGQERRRPTARGTVAVATAGGAAGLTGASTDAVGGDATPVELRRASCRQRRRLGRRRRRRG